MSILAYSQNTKQVDLISAGTLHQNINASERSTITDLTLTGCIDARDFKFIRDQLLVLAHLDISDVSIVAHQGSDGPEIGKYFNYAANVLPQFSFYNNSNGIAKNSLQSILLPVNLTLINSYAFSNCNGLTSIDIPNFVTTIGPSAFDGCGGLVDVTLGSAVTILSSQAFISCTNLRTLTVKSINPPSILPSTFGANIGLSNVFVPQASVNAYLSTNIWENLPIVIDKVVEVHNTVAGEIVAALANIDILSTSFSTISKLKVTGSVNSNDFSQFNNAMINLFELDLSDAVLVSDAVPLNAFNSKASLSKIMLPSSVTAIGMNAFNNCKNLKDIFPLPESLTSIGNNAFNGCTSLNGSLVIPNNVSSIGSSAFQACANLSGVLTIPSSVTTIARYAFYKCINISELVLSPTLSSISDQAFEDCSGLTNIYALNDVPPTIFQNTFHRVNKLACTLYVPYGSRAAYQSANHWNSFSNIVERSEYQNMTIEVGAGGRIVDGSLIMANDTLIEVLSGTSKTFSIETDPFYEIDSLVYNGVNVTSEIIGNQFTIDEFNFSSTLQITFKRHYEIVIEIGTGGIVKEDDVILADSSVLIAFTNDIITFSITAATGYELTRATYGAKDIMSQIVGVNGSSTFTTAPINANDTLSVWFEEFFDIDFEIAVGGRVEQSGQTILPDSLLRVYANNEISFDFVPDPGYVLDNVVYGDINVTQQVIENQFTTAPIHANGTLKVTFKEYFEIAIRIGTGGNIEENNRNLPTDTILIAFVDDTKIFTIIADDGYELDSVTYGGVNVTSLIVDDQFTTAPINASDSLIVTFKQLFVTYDITLNLGANGSVSVDTISYKNDTILTVRENATITFIFTPMIGYEVATVIYGGVDIKSQLINNKYTTQAIDSDLTLEVTFKMIHYFLSIKIPTSGSIDLIVAYGDKPSFSLNPSTGWKVNTVIYGGDDISNSHVDGVYTLSSVFNNVGLNVSFVEDLGTDAPESIMSHVKVYSNGNSAIVVEGLAEGENISVYSVSGQLIFDAISDSDKTEISLPDNKVYIVKTKLHSYKVLL